MHIKEVESAYIPLNQSVISKFNTMIIFTTTLSCICPVYSFAMVRELERYYFPGSWEKSVLCPAVNLRHSV